MNRRDFCRSMALGGMALALPHWLRGAVKGRTSEKPNIVFVLFDDMGWGQPPSYRAETEFKTPNLDRLAREGMRFTDSRCRGGLYAHSLWRAHGALPLADRAVWRADENATGLGLFPV